MLVCLLRHGETAWNGERRYQGRADVPLSVRGRGLLRPSDLRPERVYVSPLRRARETAAILFPAAEQVAVAGLREMDFGAFEGRTADEMAGDAAYRAWVEGGCDGPCPGGEDWAAFSRRTCRAFRRLAAEGPELLVIVAHGGTQMAVLDRYGRPPRSSRYHWTSRPGGGFLLSCRDWRTARELTVLEDVYWGV